MDMNGRRIAACGLAAGAVINLSALLMVPAVGAQMEAALRALGLPPLGAGAALFVVALSLANGVALVWLYAAVEPRLGPGRKTAAAVSLLVWFLAYGGPLASKAVFGYLPAGLCLAGAAWGLVELLLAGLVGAWLYRRGRSGAAERLRGLGAIGSAP